MKFYNERVATRHKRAAERSAKRADQKAAMKELRGLFGDKQPDPAEKTAGPDERDYKAWGKRKHLNAIYNCLGRGY